MRRARLTRPRTLVRTVTAALALVLTAPLVGSTPATAEESAPHARKLASQRQVALATPGDFTGYGFDQCVAPTQSAMDAWWKKSPFTAVGIYISGDSRACRTQPNLSSTWVATQVARGWRLLPIALNGCAGFAQYRQVSPGVWRPWSMQVIEVVDGAISAHHTFLYPETFVAFGFPAGLTS